MIPRIELANGHTPLSDLCDRCAPDSPLAVPDLLRGLEAVLVAVIGRDGTLRDANQGYLRMFDGSSAPATEGIDTRASFLTPRFDEILRRPVDPYAGTVYHGLLRLCGPKGSPLALRGSIYRHEGEFLVIAEHDISGTVATRARIRELQSDLAERQRSIADLEAQLRQLQALNDAAMHDRDTLIDALTGRSPRGLD